MHWILEFLLSLKHVQLTDWSRVRFTFLTWENAHWSIQLAIVAIALALLAYGIISYLWQSTTPAKRLISGLLRAAVLVLVLLLFLRPALVLDQDLRTPSVVAVWIDESASMSLPDPYKEPAMRDLVQLVSQKVKLPDGIQRADRYDLAIHGLMEPKDNWIHKLAAHQHVAIFTGGPHALLVGVAQNPEQLDAVLAKLKDRKPEQASTDVPVAVTDMFRQLQGQPVSAAVVMTDGRSTEGALPTTATALALQHRTPIFAIPLGQEHEPLNVAVPTPVVPENTFVKDPVVVKVKVHVAGIDRPTPVKLHLLRLGGPEGGGGGKAETELLTKDITADPAKKDYDVELVFKPEKKSPEKSERFDLVVRADPIGDELTLKDNTSTVVSTMVMDAKVNVLYVEGYPRWEYRYLKNELIREKTVNVSAILLSAEENFAQEGDPEEKDASGVVTFPGPLKSFPETPVDLAKYDVILIGDVEPTYFSPTQMRMIADFVRKGGGGVGFIAGWQYNPNSYKNTPLEPLLPIIPDDPNAVMNVSNEGFNPVLTAAGKESNLFRFFDDPEENAKQMADNPELYWYRPVVGLKGSAEVLAVHPTKNMGAQPAPLIVTGRYGAGRTVYSAICDTWRWRRYRGEPLYQSYWLQMCRLLYREKAMGQSRRVELLADSPVVEVGKPLRLTATIKDATLTNAAPGQISVQVTDEKGQALEPVTLTRVGTSQETYQGVTTINQTGALRLQVVPGAFPVDVAPIEVKVKGPEREFADTTVDMTALHVLADRTEGQVVKLTSAGQLGQLIADKSRLDLITLSEELWYKPIALILVVALLTIEWLVRKAAGLI